ncbi:MAG: PAS domain-containing protein [Chromatiales bacterium]|nr:PAS domain-containing protein [Chromatiales bacterium]
MNHPLRQPNQLARPSWRTLLLLLAVTLTILAIGGYTFQGFREVIRNNTDQNLSAVAEQKRYQIEHLLTETRRDVEAFASGSSQLPDRLERWIAGGRRDGVLLDRMQGRTHEMADIKDWLGAAVFDDDGRELFRVGTVESGPDPDLLAEVRARPEIRFMDLRANRAGVWEYSYLTPIRFRDGPVVGAFYVTLALESRLLPLVQSWPLPSETAESFLIRRSGMEREYLTPLRHPSAVTLNRRGPLDEPRLPAAWALQGRYGILRGGLDYRGEPVLAYAAPIAGTSWVMIAKIDEREALAAIDTVLWATSLVLAVVLALTYAIGFLLWRREHQRRERAALESRHAIEERESELNAARQANAHVEHWKRALDGAGHAVWDWDLKAGTVDFSASWHELIGYRPGELSHHLTEWSERIHPDDRAETFALVQAHIDGRAERYESIHRMRHRDGHWVWILDRGMIFERAPDGTPMRMIGTHTDISALRQAQENLRLAIESARLGVWNWDITTDRIASWGHFRAQFGLAPNAEPSYEEFLTLLHPEDRAPTDHQVRRSLETQDDFLIEYRVPQPDGSYRWISVCGRAYGPPVGLPERMSGITLDITERKRMEEELRAREQNFRELNADLERQVTARTAEARSASAAKSEFLAHMSHEIRTPLNAVLGLAQILAREPMPADQHELVEHIQDAGQSLLALINDILDFSKIEAGQLRLESQPFHLDALLAKVESLMLSTAQSRGLTLSIETPAAPIGPLLGDALRLDQVLLNLIGNAIKFTEHGGIRLRIRMLESNEHELRLRFEVSDSGIGIEPQTLSRLFQAFTQANGDITRRFGGTGLGLSISKRLVELMGGHIGVESQVGQGSTFWFELPFAHAAPETIVPAPPPVRATSGPRLVGRHLLVVDDSAMNREVVERALDHEGARVTLAVDGQQALQTLEAHPNGFDAVLMDVRMPVMDGLTATRLIRDRLGLTELPIIALTAGVTTEEQAAARTAGVDDILPKPLDLERLTERLVTRIGRRPPVNERVEPVTTPQSDARADDSMAAADHEALPDIPGIDRALAARSLGTEPAFFLRLLARFVGEQHEVVDRARTALDAGARDQATHALHRLRGEAGHLGATDLMRMAEHLELAIEQGAPPSELEPDLKALEQRLMDFIVLSAPWIMNAEPDSATAPESAPAPDPERLAALRTALNENNLRARRIFNELEPALRGSLGVAGCRALGAAIRDLRFEAALAVLEDAASEPPSAG